MRIELFCALNFTVFYLECVEVAVSANVELSLFHCCCHVVQMHGLFTFVLYGANCSPPSGRIWFVSDYLLRILFFLIWHAEGSSMFRAVLLGVLLLLGRMVVFIIVASLDRFAAS